MQWRVGTGKGYGATETAQTEEQEMVGMCHSFINEAKTLSSML